MTAGMQAGLRHRLRRALRHMEAQHRQLGPILHELQDAAKEGAHDRIRGGLARFTEALSAHFELEDNTVFPAIHGLVPNTEREIHALVRDHQGFLRRLSALRQSLAPDPAGAEQLDDLAHELREHEMREEALVAIAIREAAG